MLTIKNLEGELKNKFGSEISSVNFEGFRHLEFLAGLYSFKAL
jgi:hypothetical protein